MHGTCRGHGQLASQPTLQLAISVGDTLVSIPPAPHRDKSLLARPALGEPGTLDEQLALAGAGLTRRPQPYGRDGLLALLATLAAYRPEVREALGLSSEGSHP